MDENTSNIVSVPEVISQPDVHIVFCPYCGNTIQALDLFCPHCGKSLDILHGIGVGRQIYIYTMSLVLPPAGVVYWMRFLKSPNSQVKTVGFVALVLTVISLGVSLWIVLDVIHQAQDAFSKYGNMGL